MVDYNSLNIKIKIACIYYGKYNMYILFLMVNITLKIVLY